MNNAIIIFMSAALAAPAFGSPEMCVCEGKYPACGQSTDFDACYYNSKKCTWKCPGQGDPTLGSSGDPFNGEKALGQADAGSNGWNWPGTEGNKCWFGQWCNWGLSCVRNVFGAEVSTTCVRRNSGGGGNGEPCEHGMFCNQGLSCVSEPFQKRRVCRYPDGKEGVSPSSPVTSRLGAAVKKTSGNMKDQYCPNRCAIWSYDSSGNRSKYCVKEGWTVTGDQVYPNPMTCYEPVTCRPIEGGKYTQWCCGTC